MIMFPRTLGGQMALLSFGLMTLFATGTAMSAAPQASTPKSDRAPLAYLAGDSCQAQTWPNIDRGCLHNISSAAAPVGRVRYITFGRNIEPNTTVLFRVPVTQQADAR